MQLDQSGPKQQSADDATLLHDIDIMFADVRSDKIAVAVSGGGDSMALLHLFIRWSAQTGVSVVAVTLDHGLRPEAAGEAEFVGRFCAAHGVSHTILNWVGSHAVGNVQAAAREARYAMIAAWALEHGAGAVALGHTADDIAETFLMRLARKSGVDGLAAMPHRFERCGVRWGRPLWQRRRTALRDYLRRHDLDWIDDPSNEDLTQTRPQARTILGALAPLGIDVDVLQSTASALASARSALQAWAIEEALRVVTLENGDVLIATHSGPPVHPEIARRLQLAALYFINGAAYAPRESALIHLEAALINQSRHTVAGCIVTKVEGGLRYCREFNAVEGPVVWPDRAVAIVWDGRWTLRKNDGSDHAGNLTVRALGDALSDVADWQKSGLPRASLLASPAVFDRDTLVAAPVAGLQNGFSARIVADFASFLVCR